jgi:hypothetical protein
MMKKQLFSWFALLFLSFTLLAQTQTIKGTILDKQSEMPLIGATVALVGDMPMGTTTDANGYFRLENVPLGRQALQINYLGYSSMTIPNVVVTAGKEVILELTLEESLASLQEVVVTADAEKDKAINEMAAVSARTFSLEEVNRYSGGRGDVARLVGNFAGVATANDSRNDIVIRGNSPTGVLWRLEGIPIPNPNHFSTLGTTGGPVGALNTNLLKNSDFMTSAFPAEYGNALAGVFDLGFRSGNRDRSEFMLQMGAFTGMEAMAEGPLKKGNGSSYLVAGRYSFVSVAQEVGLNVGTNAIPNYRDIAFKIDFGDSKLGKFGLFGIGGVSDINFDRNEVDETDLFTAPDENSYAESQFGVIGLKHNYLIGNKTYIRTVIAASNSGNIFTQDRFLLTDENKEIELRIFDVNNTTNRYSLSSYVNHKANAKLTFRSGVLLEREQLTLENITRDETPDLDGDGLPDAFLVYGFEGGATIIQPFGQAKYRLNSALTLNAGLHGQYLDLNDNFVLEPRLALSWNVAANQTINIGYGLHQQNQPLPILLIQEPITTGDFIESNRNLKFTRSNHFVLGYDIKLGKEWRGKLETYYQAIDRVPIEATPSSFSILNVGADFGFPDDAYGLVNEGTGYNTGVELTIEKFYSKGYYTLLTASLFDSKYKGSDGVERNTTFNNQYVLNFLAGKEITVNKRIALTFDTKFTIAGGRYYTPIDLVASKAIGREVRVKEEAFSLQYAPYLRWDVKFGMRMNSAKQKLSHQFYFDIQNVTNNQNIFVDRYNRLTNQVNTVYQIGFFPDFMYRLQF